VQLYSGECRSPPFSEQPQIPQLADFQQHNESSPMSSRTNLSQRSRRISSQSKWEGGVTLIDENVTYVDYVPEIHNGNLVRNAKQNSPPNNYSSSKPHDRSHLQDTPYISSQAQIAEGETWGKYAMEKKKSNDAPLRPPPGFGPLESKAHADFETDRNSYKHQNKQYEGLNSRVTPNTGHNGHSYSNSIGMIPLVRYSNSCIQVRNLKTGTMITWKRGLLWSGQETCIRKRQRCTKVLDSRAISGLITKRMSQKSPRKEDWKPIRKRNRNGMEEYLLQQTWKRRTNM
jgi:hypothetical protein